MPTNPEKRTHSSHTEHRHVRKKKDPTLFWRIATALLFLAVIVLGGLLYLTKAGIELFPEPPVTAVPEVTPELRFTASCVTPLGETLSVSAVAGEAVTLPEGPAIDGYTFIGWNDSNGNPVAGNHVTLTADASFAAVYAIAFRDESRLASHEPYLPLGDDGCFHPTLSLTRSEAVKLLYESLDTNLVGSASFADVDPSAPYYRAAATLKDLGVLKDSRFHPNDPIGLDELFAMLAQFFPKSGSAYAFEHIAEIDARYADFCLAMDRGWIDDLAVVPEHDLTRAEAAHIFNALRGRTVAEEDYSKVGTILDVSFRNPCFWDIAEAAVEHVPAQGEHGEQWTSSSALALLPEGTFFVGTALHCVDGQGSAVVGESYGNFDFGLDGVITTGMPELDKLVQDKLVELKLDPAVMTGEEMLNTIYNHVTYSNSYLGARNDQLHEVGDISWVNDAAYHMLTVRKGCCYNFAAEFYVLAKAIGYDAIIYSGRINPPPLVRPHGWVEIEFDGVPYIFDTELEYTQVMAGNYGTRYFKQTYERLKGWYYYRGEEDANVPGSDAAA